MEQAFFRRAYREAMAAWDVPCPQPAFVMAAAADGFQGRILDLGCGTGENAMLAASMGFSVTGVDFAPEAVQMARRKAAHRGLPVSIVQSDALRVRLPPHSFGTVIDSGFFHGLSRRSQGHYWAQVQRLLVPGGHLFILAFDGPDAAIFRELASAPPGVRLESVTPAFFLIANGVGLEPTPAVLARYRTRRGPVRRPSERPSRARATSADGPRQR